MTRVVAVVAAKDSEGEVGKAVEALRAVDVIDEVVVVDDGSRDATANEARIAGARVITHPRNRGKAAAVRSGIIATPNADVYLLVDSDTAKTAGAASALLEPVLADDADLVIGALPSAGGKGGFGSIVRIARWGIKHACGYEARAPLSGQRAVKAEVVRSMTFAPRYGLEVAMTIDAVRRNARVIELDVAMDHRHRGRRLAGFMHRGRQGAQILAALWTRLVLPRARVALLVLTAFLGAMGLLSIASFHQRDRGEPLAVGEVAIVAVPGATWDDVPIGARSSGTWASVVTGKSEDPLVTLASGTRAEDSNGAELEVTTGQSFARAIEEAKGPTFVLGIDDDSKALRPAVLVGGPDGALYSSSTRDTALIDLTDVSATVLTRSPVIADVQGRDLRFVGGSANSAASTAEHLSKAVTIDNQLRIFIVVALCVLGLVATILGVRGVRWATEVGLVLAAVPLASYLVRALDLAPLNAAIQALVILVLGAIIAGGLALFTSSRWSAMRWVLGLTIGVITIDLITGATLQTSGVFGSDPSFGRFFGIGNPASVLLLVGAVLAAAMHVEASGQKAWAIARAAVFLFLITLIDALPGLGTDVGGAIAFAFISVTTVIALSGRRASVKTVSLAGFGAIVAFGAIALLDASRAAGSRTELGNLVVDVREKGFGPFADIAQRKIESNLFSYGFPWSMLVLVAAIVIFAVLVKGSRWSKPLNGIPRTATALAILASLSLYVLNDSGIVVVGLVAVYLIPFVLVQDEAVLSRNLEETTWRS